MTAKTLLELAKQVEALDGPDREVDCQIYIAVHGDKEFGNAWPFKPDTPPMLSEYVAQFRGTLAADDAIPDSFVPRYTASLGAAMTLADSDAMAIGILQEAIERLEDNGWPKGEWAKQLPRYVTAAALRAKEATNEQ